MKPLPHWTSAAIARLRPSVARPSPGQVPLDVAAEVEAADKSGALAEVLTVFLRGSECSYRCLMCDLWKYTHRGATPRGALPAQLAHALSDLSTARRPSPAAPGPRWIKLYNASNFFSPTNVPREDLSAIAELVHDFDRVIVENHPKMIDASISTFQEQLGGRLEVAMGLETVHPATLQRLNKQLTLDDFARACEWLLERGIDIRTFVLLRPPGMNQQEGVEWCVRSVEFAHRLGVRHVSIIPVRGGNGALEHLRQLDLFEPPSADCLEQALGRVIRLPGAVITADLWDWESLAGVTAQCSSARRLRLENANLSQQFAAV